MADDKGKFWKGLAQFGKDMLPNVAQAGLDIGMGVLGGQYQDKRQLRQQEKLMAMQQRGNKEMADYNQALALDMWNKTNYDAQVRQLKKAGLSVGLMYGGSGAGGSTAGAGAAQGVSGGMAASAQDLGVAQMLAGIENTKADTGQKKAQTEAVELTNRQQEMDNWLQDFLIQYTGKAKFSTLDSDGKRREYTSPELYRMFKDGSIDFDLDPRISSEFQDLLNKETERNLNLSRKEEQDLKNEARRFGVTDMDDMYIRMGARYAIEQGINRNDARFSLVAASAAVSLFEIFSKFGIAKNLANSAAKLKGKGKGKAE